MNGSTVTAFAVNSDGSNGSQLGTGTTDSNGNFTLKITPPSGPVRLTASGGSYVSEMNGATISSPAALSKILLAPTPGQSGISVNPLTDFVNSMALALTAGGAPFNTAVTNAAKNVESYYGLATEPGKIVPDYTAAGVGTDAGNLGLILGALINEDQYLCPGSPGGLVTALSADISDGIFNGIADGKPVPYCGGNLPAIAGISMFQDALSGMQKMLLVTQAFAFGGAGNILTTNGLADLATGGSTAYSLAPLAKINLAIPQAAPTAVNSLAPPAQTATMNAAREQAAQAVLPNGKVLIAGGYGGAADLTSTELYDAPTNTFAPVSGTASMNEARDSFTITSLPNGKVLMAGGFTVSTFTAIASTELYDPHTNTFAPSSGTAVMNAARYLATATLLPNGKVLIAGGYDINGNSLVSTELYDPSTNTFAPASGTATMNVLRAEAMATLLPNGKVLIAGGYNLANTELSSTELYDPSTNTFAAPSGTATMNSAHDYGTATMLPNGKVLIAGGYDITDSPGPTTELYDPATNTFAPVSGTATMNVPRAEDVAMQLPNGNVLIAGGYDGISELASTELYNSTANTFAPPSGTVTMNAARDYPTGSLLPNGKALIAGGFGNGTWNASTDLYTP